jgi:hypothetical protein
MIMTPSAEHAGGRSASRDENIMIAIWDAC